MTMPHGTACPHSLQQPVACSLRTRFSSPQAPLRLVASRVAVVASAAGGEGPAPRYSSDGRRRATLEEAGWAQRHLHSGKAPWQMGFQMREQSLEWNEGLKARLYAHAAARDLGVDERVLERRLEEVAALLPGIRRQLRAFKPQTLALLVSSPKRLADTLVSLKRVFPRADALRLLAGLPTLVLCDEEAVAGTAAALRERLPDLDLEELVMAFPMALNFPAFNALLEDFQRLCPGADLQHTLRTSPNIIFSLQKGQDLIPYDEPYQG